MSKYMILGFGHVFIHLFCIKECNSHGRGGRSRWHELPSATRLQQRFPPGLHPAPANLLPFSKTSLQVLMKWRQPMGPTRGHLGCSRPYSQSDPSCRTMVPVPCEYPQQLKVAMAW